MLKTVFLSAFGQAVLLQIKTSDETEGTQVDGINPYDCEVGPLVPCLEPEEVEGCQMVSVSQSEMVGPVFNWIPTPPDCGFMAVDMGYSFGGSSYGSMVWESWPCYEESICCCEEIPDCISIEPILPVIP